VINFAEMLLMEGRSYKFVFFFLLNIIYLEAQINLVLNPSFEQFDGCPNTWNEADSAKYWDWINPSCNFTSSFNCRGELFTSLCPLTTFSVYYNVPYNIEATYQKPHSGNSYIGTHSVYGTPSQLDNRRDYLKGQLTQTLSAGKNYCLKFYYNASNRLQYATNRYGAYVDNGNVSNYNCCKDIPILPQAENNPAVFMTDTMNWVRIQGSFTALGNENTITLGNFVDSVTIQYQAFNLMSGSLNPYYLIDDVSLVSMDSVAFAGYDKGICLGDSVFLGRKQETGLECTWYDLSGNILGDSAGMWVKPTNTQTYIVKMDNCLVSFDTITVTIKPALNGNVAVSAMPPIVCPNQQAQLQTNISNPGSGLQFNWQLETSLSNLTIPNPIATPTIGTTYQLVTSSGPQSNYCGIDTSSVMVQVIALQLPADAGQDEQVCSDQPSITIGLDSVLCTWCGFSWSPSEGLLNPSAPSTVFAPSGLPSGVHTYILTKSDSCQITQDSILIIIQDCFVSLSFPNIFTPNGDEINDVWEPMTIGDKSLVSKFSLVIYNRWGINVFDSENLESAWDGRSTSGIACQDGTYYYVVEYLTDKKNKSRGFIELIR